MPISYSDFLLWFFYSNLLNQFYTPIYYRYFLQRFLTVSVQSRPSFLSCCNPPPPLGRASPQDCAAPVAGCSVRPQHMQGKQKHVCVYWASKNMLALLCQQMRWFHAQMGAVVPRYFFAPWERERELWFWLSVVRKSCPVAEEFTTTGFLPKLR